MGADRYAGSHDAQIYAAMIEMVDRQIGEIFALLKTWNLDQQTIVFLSGDNGGQPCFHGAKHPDGFFRPNVDPKTGQRFRGGKGSLYEGGLRIPFLVRWPGQIRANTVSDFLGYFPDMMPTLAELAHIDSPADGDGHVRAIVAAGRISDVKPRFSSFLQKIRLFFRNKRPVSWCFRIYIYRGVVESS